MPDEVKIEVDIASEDRATEAGILSFGQPSYFACPECHGVLLQMKDSVPVRFRCHTGHAYTLESLLSDMDEKIEDSLWNAIRALEERALLIQRAAEHDEDRGDLSKRAGDARRRADLVRQALEKESGASIATNSRK